MGELCIPIDEIFETAAGIDDPQARDGFLVKACGGDSRLVEQLQTLLQQRGKADKFFRQIGFDEPPTSASYEKTSKRRLVSDFELFECVGKGGMGAVYRAINVNTGVKVALKIPQIPLIGNPTLIRMFIREARTARSLKHPNLAPIVDSGYANTVCYIASKWIEDGDLATWLKSKPGPRNPRSVLKFLIPLANAISYCHERNIVHLDLKPANVLLERKPLQPTSGQRNTQVLASVDDHEFDLDAMSPCLADFGIATSTDANTSSDSFKDFVQGTPVYMSPEQMLGQRDLVGCRTDVYGMGLILYELLYGKALYSDCTKDVILNALKTNDFIPMPDSVSVPTGIRNICQKCLRNLPKDRYADVKTLEADMRAFLDGRPLTAKSLWFQRLVARVRSLRRKPKSSPVIVSAKNS